MAQQHFDVRKAFPSLKFETVFDVGANVGQTIREFGRDFPNARIYSFEPIRASYEKLSAFKSDRTSLFNMAISDKDGHLAFLMDGSSTMNRAMAGSESSEGAVKSSRLDTFCFENRIAQIDYLKVDTEGHELHVLRGAGQFLHNVKFIELEASMNAYNEYHVAFSELQNFLSERGFYLFGIYEQCMEWGGGGYPILRRANPVFVNSHLIGPLRNVIVS